MSHMMSLCTKIASVALVYKALYHMNLLPHMLFSEVDNETCIYDVEAVSHEWHRENDIRGE